MIDSYTKTPRPLRRVDVDYLINQTKCENCVDKPCLGSCPIDAIYMDDDDGLVKIKNTCFGCVLCRNACPYDAISLDVQMDPPIKEEVPNINIKLCKACGACVQACKNGSIHIFNDGKHPPHSEIDKDTCVRCGYCFRVCPTDAIKYGQLLPKTVKGGKAIVVNQDIKAEITFEKNLIGGAYARKTVTQNKVIPATVTAELPKEKQTEAQTQEQTESQAETETQTETEAESESETEAETESEELVYEAAAEKGLPGGAKAGTVTVTKVKDDQSLLEGAQLALYNTKELTPEEGSFRTESM